MRRNRSLPVLAPSFDFASGMTDKSGRGEALPRFAALRRWMTQSHMVCGIQDEQEVLWNEITLMNAKIGRVAQN